MGCCQDSNAVSLNANVFSEKLKEAIDSSSIKRVAAVVDVFNKKKKKEAKIIDKDIVTLNNIYLNPLSYCCLLGKDKIFKYLIEKGASLKAMEEKMADQNIRPINLICLKGHLEVLKVYLPHFMQNYEINTRKSLKSAISYTIDFNDKEIPQFYDLAIHSACRAGMINIVSYLYNYFKESEIVPAEFDIHRLDEGFGEDAGLIACRVGCFQLVKFLHEQCGVNYTRLNVNKENAIMICVCGNKKTPNFSYLECLNYLVEIVKVDITYMYEEVLLIAESSDIIFYLESQLEKAGITVKKSDIDKEIAHKKTIVESGLSNNSPIFNDKFIKENGDYRSFLSSISSEGNICSSWNEGLEPFNR